MTTHRPAAGLLLFAVVTACGAITVSPARAQNRAADERAYQQDLKLLRDWKDKYGPAPARDLVDRLEARLRDRSTDPHAMYWLSVVYAGGIDGVPQDLRRHAQLLGKAAELGQPRAQATLASYYLKGLGVTKDYRQAMELAAAAAAGGEARGHAVLAEIHETGAGVPKNQAAALQHYRQASAMGFDPATLGLGLAYAYGQEVEKNEHAGFELVKKAAENGLNAAQYQLAILYLRGVGTVRNEVEAGRWMLAAAKQEYVPAIAAMGDLLLVLDPGQKQPAAMWHRQAAEKGDPPAMRKWALSLLRGEGTAVNLDEGLRWLNKSADAGDPEAMETLGIMHLAGAGVLRDRDKAEILLKAAADAGRANADMFLRLMRESGQL